VSGARQILGKTKKKEGVYIDLTLALIVTLVPSFLYAACNIAPTQHGGGPIG
jgi:hypothetical protein